MMIMADPVAFLHARFDEDEKAATAAAYVAPGRWHSETYRNSRGTMSGDLFTEGGDFADERLGYDGRLWGGWDEHPWTAAEVAEHLARHDPARVLADVQAKRAIIAAISQWQHDDPDDGGFYACPATRTETLGDLGPESFGEENCTCGVLARQRQIATLLASAYADHPDFDSTWNPSQTHV